VAKSASSSTHKENLEKFPGQKGSGICPQEGGEEKNSPVGEKENKRTGGKECTGYSDLAVGGSSEKTRLSQFRKRVKKALQGT